MGNSQLEPDLEAGNQPSLLKQSRYVGTGAFQATTGKEGAACIDINRKAIRSGTSKAIAFKDGGGGFAYRRSADDANSSLFRQERLGSYRDST